MLEQRVLLLRPRKGSATQAIVDGETGRTVGFARWPEAPGPWWRRLALAVHEQEDEPLVFTVHRAWSLLPRREVRDADGGPVGSVRGGQIHDAWGRPRAVLLTDNGTGVRVFRGRGGQELARLSAGPDGERLAFNPDVGDPFLRMLLLAAALSEPRASASGESRAR